MTTEREPHHGPAGRLKVLDEHPGIAKPRRHRQRSEQPGVVELDDGFLDDIQEERPCGIEPRVPGFDQGLHGQQLGPRSASPDLIGMAKIKQQSFDELRANRAFTRRPNDRVQPHVSLPSICSL
jgi:hypothetical protein